MFSSEHSLAIVVQEQAVAEHLVQTGCSTLVSVKTDAFWEDGPDGQLKKARTPEEVAKEKKAILDMIAGEVTLRSKRELIQKFIEENLPLIHDVDAIPDEFDRYVQQEKTLALGRICEEEKLDREQFSALMESYIYSNQEPIRDDILKCWGEKILLLQRKEIGNRILERMREFVSTFVEGMVA